MKKVTGSEAVLLSLIEEGVEVMFGYPGGNIMPIYDALYDYQEKIKHILTRHEQGATHAAQGYARVTGKVGVCMATSGPGATNLITGIADAMLDSTPMVCITGQVGSPLLGTDAFQETDVIGITMPVTKWNYQVTKASDIPAAIAKAFYIARSGRPGPVLIDITKDAQFAQMEFKYKKCEGIRSYIPVPKPDAEKIEEAANLINKAERPFALVGQGVVLGGAEKEVTAFLEKAGIPFAWTLLGLSALPTEHPLNVGMLGMHGNYGPNKLTNECDVLIGIGMRFDDRVTGDVKRYAKQAKVIHLEIDPSEINKNVKSAVAILGDVKETVPMLTDKVKANLHHDWIQEFKKCEAIENEKVISKDMYPEKPGLSMGEVIRRINENAKGEAILVTDVGQHQMIAARYTKFNNTRSIVTSGGLGTMGFGLPAAIGAKLGMPDKHVVAIIGDGGFQMTIQELGTIFQTGVAVKIVLLNNNFLGMVRQWQQLFFDKRYSSTELINPDFLTIAKGYCIDGQKVTKRDDLDEAVKKMLDHNGPYLLEVVVEKEGNVFPMVPAGCCVSEIRLE
ncbi:MAG TPA: biosynthetic-type acetolactate synthase large subunit [Bacteroidales bacterium]|nr:biosynthetic-type acetolactate synthase large subunit [Bacteroidales bacterium]